MDKTVVVGGVIFLVFVAVIVIGMRRRDRNDVQSGDGSGNVKRPTRWFEFEK